MHKCVYNFIYFFHGQLSAHWRAALRHIFISKGAAALSNAPASARWNYDPPNMCKSPLSGCMLSHSEYIILIDSRPALTADWLDIIIRIEIFNLSK